MPSTFKVLIWLNSRNVRQRLQFYNSNDSRLLHFEGCWRLNITMKMACLFCFYKTL